MARTSSPSHLQPEAQHDPAALSAGAMELAAYLHASDKKSNKRNTLGASLSVTAVPSTASLRRPSQTPGVSTPNPQISYRREDSSSKLWAPTNLLTQKEFDVYFYKRLAMQKLQSKLKRMPSLTQILMTSEIDELILNAVNYSRIFLKVSQLEKADEQNMQNQPLVDPERYTIHTKHVNSQLEAENRLKEFALQKVAKTYCKLLMLISKFNFEPSSERECYETIYSVTFEVIRTSLGPGGITGFTVGARNISLIISELNRLFRSNLFVSEDKSLIETPRMEKPSKGVTTAESDHPGYKLDESRVQTAVDGDRNHGDREDNHVEHPAARGQSRASNKLNGNPVIVLDTDEHERVSSEPKSRRHREYKRKVHLPEVRKQRSPLMDSVLAPSPPWLFLNASFGVKGI